MVAVQSKRVRGKKQEAVRVLTPVPKSEMVYQYRSGAQVRGVKAQIAGLRLDTLQSKYGFITPDLVVEDATPVDAPLHPAFEWDDTQAAVEHRKQQARLLIGSVVAVHYTSQVTEGGDEIGPMTPVTVRAFVIVQEDGQRVYTSTVVAMQDDYLRTQVLERALAELRSFQSKYQHLSELAVVYEAIDQVRGQE